jgi:hypothetical protein
MKPGLGGVRLKIERAKIHMRQLKTAIEAWNGHEKENDSAVIYADSERQALDIAIGGVRQSDPMWAAMVGDVAHNLRSALDHLVCQLALLNGNGIECCNDTCFPICSSGPDFRNKARKIKSLLSNEAFAEIKKLQPYNAPNLTHNNLWIISELDIIDKHRMLVVVTRQYRPTKVGYTVNDATPVSVPFIQRWRPIEEGAEIATIDLSRFTLGEKDKMNMYIETEVEICLKGTGTGCDRLPVDKALIPCIRCVSEIVDSFETQFFK